VVDILGIRIEIICITIVYIDINISYKFKGDYIGSDIKNIAEEADGSGVNYLPCNQL